MARPCCEKAVRGLMCPHFEAELLAVIEDFRRRGRPAPECQRELLARIRAREAARASPDLIHSWHPAAS